MMGPRLLVLAVALLALSPPDRRGAQVLPIGLCVSNSADAAVSHNAASIVVARAAYRQLEGSQRRKLLDALEESVTRREAQINPLFDDFGEGDPDSDLHNLIEGDVQTFGTARALLSSRYCGSDGFCVRVTMGECAKHERAPIGRELERARFLAWPYAYAERVPMADASDHDWSIEALRRRPGVALVLEGAEAPMRPDERRFLQLFERREVLLRIEHGENVNESARGLTEESRILRANEVLVIPSLETVADALARQ
jgi:hypothetical protein